MVSFFKERKRRERNWCCDLLDFLLSLSAPLLARERMKYIYNYLHRYTERGERKCGPSLQGRRDQTPTRRPFLTPLHQMMRQNKNIIPLFCCCCRLYIFISRPIKKRKSCCIYFPAASSPFIQLSPVFWAWNILLVPTLFFDSFLRCRSFQLIFNATCLFSLSSFRFLFGWLAMRRSPLSKHDETLSPNRRRRQVNRSLYDDAYLNIAMDYLARKKKMERLLDIMINTTWRILPKKKEEEKNIPGERCCA